MIRLKTVIKVTSTNYKSANKYKDVLLNKIFGVMSIVGDTVAVRTVGNHFYNLFGYTLVPVCTCGRI